MTYEQLLENKKIPLTCKECGKVHLKLKCQLTRGRGKFCSKECANDHRKSGSELACFNCQKKFYRRFGEQGETEKPFCSKACYEDNRRVNAKKSTYLKEGARHIHIIISEKALGRELTDHEIVHHIDFDKHNNNINNLAILPNQAFHAQVHFGNADFEKYKLINLIA